jgi:murein endopeptidase
MRSLVVAMALLAFATVADAKPRRAKKTVSAKLDKSSSSSSSSSKAKKAAAKTKGKKKRVAITSRRQQRFVLRGPAEGQSLGACWLGRLREATKLGEGDGWYIRRPYRAFGTTTTVEHVERILADINERFPDIHDIAVGDISAETGGRISEHSSHQSGRDIDIGLIFTEKPDAYPHSFVVGDADNLDLEATFVLVEEFAKTSEYSAGVQMIFLDFDLQGLLYQWALDNGETPEYLAKLFQFPHGRGASAGLVRHEPHHADHIHVRFRCPLGDTACR